MSEEPVITPLIEEKKKPFLKKHFNILIFILFGIFLIIALIQIYLVKLKYDENKSLSENIENQKQHATKFIIMLVVSIVLDILVLFYIIKYSEKMNKVKNIILYVCVGIILLSSIISIILCTQLKSGDTIDIYNQNKKYLDTVEIFNLISGVGPRVLLLMYVIGFNIMKYVNKRNSYKVS